jgi:hypothetical protein
LIHLTPPSSFGRSCGADSEAHAKESSKYCFFEKEQQKTFAILGRVVNCGLAAI